MYFILEVDNNIFNIYDDRKEALIHLYKLNKYSKNVHLNEFKNGYINGEYSIKNNIIYYSSLDEKNDVSINKATDLPYEIIKNRNSNKTVKILTTVTTETTETTKPIVKTIEKNERESSEINVQLPPINSEINITTDQDNSVDSPECENLEELKKKIEELSKMKEKEMEELEDLNENFHEFQTKVIDEKFNRHVYYLHQIKLIKLRLDHF
jgi:hypothetical protein